MLDLHWKIYFSAMLSDKILNQLIKKYPAPKFVDRTEFLFEDLVESIISQQLSVKAANTIYGRFKDLFPVIASKAKQSRSAFPNPQQILQMDDQKIRAAGISFAKISYIKYIAKAFANNEIKIAELKNMSDEEVMMHLTNLKGVGKWTAEMTLIFTLHRPDIFSLGDAGLRRAIQTLYGITDEKKMLKLSESWKPHRSTASWYLWRSLENKS